MVHREILEGVAFTLEVRFTCEVSRTYFQSDISSLLKMMMFLLRFAPASVACGVLSLCPWFPIVIGNLSNRAGQHKGCTLEPLIRNLAGFVSLGSLQELMLPGGGSGWSWEAEAGFSRQGAP